MNCETNCDHAKKKEEEKPQKKTKTCMVDFSTFPNWHNLFRVKACFAHLHHRWFEGIDLGDRRDSVFMVCFKQKAKW